MLGLGQIVIAMCHEIRGGFVSSHSSKPFGSESGPASHVFPIEPAHPPNRFSFCARSDKSSRPGGQGFYAVWHKSEMSDQPRRIGRPRAYDPETALRLAMMTFWKGGYAGTSLDDIAAATGMNRPSLKAAFGDKHALYLKALRSYWDAKFVAMRGALSMGTLEEALLRAYDTALSVYFSGDNGPLGCFVLGTALTEALDDAEVRAIIDAGFRKLDVGFEARFRLALETGELKPDADTDALAVLACGTMQTLAIRARAGMPEGELRNVARRAARAICAHAQ